MKPKKKKSNPIWDDVINELKELGQILKAGGLPAVEKKFRVTRLNVGKLPKPAKSINPKQVKGVRAKVGVSQPVFAAFSATRAHWQRRHYLDGTPILRPLRGGCR